MTASLSRAARIVLLLSLALNLALGAWLWMHLGWRHSSGHRAHLHAPVSTLLDLRAFRRSLPPERQAVIENAFASERGEMRARLGELFQARRAVRAAIEAEPFDRAALDAAFAALRAAEDAAAAQAQRRLGDVLQQLTPEERRQWSELVPHRTPRARGRTRSSEPGAGSDAEPQPPG
jgi:Spy/CpxP family protein refolding chaperone